MSDSFHDVVNYVIPPIVLLVGLAGNIVGFLVFFGNKNMAKIGPGLTYLLLFSTDTIYLLQIIIIYLAYAFNLNLLTYTDLSCKIYIYFNYALDALSPFLLVYISIEKYFSIYLSSQKLRSIKFQLIYFFILLFFNLTVSIVHPFSYSLKSYSTPNSTNSVNNSELLVCDFNSYSGQLISSYLDFINRAVVPYILMFVFSTLLIISIFKSRNRTRSATQNRYFKKDVIFSITSFLMNLTFILLNLPLSVVLFLPDIYVNSFDIFLLTFYIYYLSYGCNFYVLYITNSIVRKESKRNFFKKSAATYTHN